MRVQQCAKRYPHLVAVNFDAELLIRILIYPNISTWCNGVSHQVMNQYDAQYSL